MKWESNLNERRKSKETRIIEKFLFFPKEIGSVTKWLQRVKIKQDIQLRDGGFNAPYVWNDLEWVTPI